MTVQTVTVVTVTIANESSLPTNFPASGPNVVVEDIQVGSDVQADLTGEGFTIARVGGDDGSRVLAEGSSATWSWQVTPQASGRRTLNISLYVRVEGPDGSPVDVRTFNRDVDVAVNPSYTIGDFFKTWWPATGLTLPVIVGAAVALLRKKRQAGNPSPPQPEPSLTPAPTLLPPDSREGSPPGYL